MRSSTDSLGRAESAATPDPVPFGMLLRDWRKRRGLSQMELALQAEVSSRHLSFLETGRSRPSREIVLHLAQQLDMPLRERNGLLVAAGYAPVFNETPLDDPAMTSVRDAIEQLLASHEPFPAIVVDRHWDIVRANAPALRLIGPGLPHALLTPAVNAIRLTLHPEGLAPRILNLGEWRSHVLARLRRQAALTADPFLTHLYEEVLAYPVPIEPSSSDTLASPLFVPLRIRDDDRELAFFSTIATFGKPTDITLAELAIESFYPANSETATLLLERWQP